jgi:hypothetical protein
VGVLPFGRIQAVDESADILDGLSKKLQGFLVFELQGLFQGGKNTHRCNPQK